MLPPSQTSTIEKFWLPVLWTRRCLATVVHCPMIFLKAPLALVGSAVLAPERAPLLGTVPGETKLFPLPVHDEPFIGTLELLREEVLVLLGIFH